MNNPYAIAVVWMGLAFVAAVCAGQAWRARHRYFRNLSTLS